MKKKKKKKRHFSLAQIPLASYISVFLSLVIGLWKKNTFLFYTIAAIRISNDAEDVFLKTN